MKRTALIICLLACPAFAVVGDFTADGCVDFSDLAILAEHWLTNDSATDLNSDSTTDLKDFAMMAANWYNCATLPPTHICQTDPDAATAPDPANHATGVVIAKTLGWTVADCNGETTLNDVWFGETGSMIKVVTASAIHSCAVTLEKSHSYQWRVDTVNAHGTTTGTVWDFNAIAQDAPVASDGTASAYTHIAQAITLSATDDSLPAPPARLRYVITALPADVDAYVQDPVSGGQIRIAASNLPYKLSSWGNTVWFATTTVGVTTFKFKTYDGEQWSAEKTITVTTVANPKDCLSFDGSGYVTIPDTGDYFDMVNGRGVGVCFSTRQPFCTLFQKYAAGKGGYWCGLIGGIITARVYDNNGVVLAEQKSSNRYDNGQWSNVVVGFNAVSERLELYTGHTETSGTWYYEGEGYLDSDAAIFPLEIWPAGNDLPLTIGTGYRYEIDAIRSYSLTMTDQFRCLSSIQIRSVAGDPEMFVPIPIVRFKCNYGGANNTATQIYDDISATHLVGTFSSSAHVRYLPWVWQWWDASALQGGR